MADALKISSQNYANAQYKATDLAKQDSAVQTYLKDMDGATSQEDAQATLNGMVSDMFMRAEKGWLAKHPDADLDASLQKFADALKSYMRGEMALENALKRAGFNAQPREMDTALSYAGTQLLQAEARGLGSDVQYSGKKGNANIAYPVDGLETGATMTNRQWRMFYEKIAEIRRGESDAFTRTRDGKFILAIDNKLIYADGAWNNPRNNLWQND